MKLLLLKKINKISKKTLQVLIRFRLILLLVFFLGIVTDLYYLTSYTDLSLFSLLSLWIFISIAYEFKSDMTFKLSLVFLFVMFIYFIIARESLIVERIAIWFYLILFVGMIQQFIELRRMRNKS